MSAVSAWTDQQVIPVLGSRFHDMMLFGGAAVFCLFVGVRLVQGRVWWTAVAASVLVFALGLLLVWSFLHPRNDFERSEYTEFGFSVQSFL
jgi:hypothetical protein